MYLKNAESTGAENFQSCTTRECFISENYQLLGKVSSVCWIFSEVVKFLEGYSDLLKLAKSTLKFKNITDTFFPKAENFQK